MNRALKKVVLLFVVSLIFVMGLQLVYAISPVDLNVSKVKVAERTGRDAFGIANGVDLSPFNKQYYLTNVTYQINITVIRTNDSVNISEINITLPTGYTFIEWSNLTNATGINFTNTSNTEPGGQVLSWGNKTCGLKKAAGVEGNPCFLNSSLPVLITFNFSVNTSAAAGNNSFKITMVGNSSNTTDEGLILIANVTDLNHNISFDATLPTVTTAVTQHSLEGDHSTNHTINLTFSEAMDLSTCSDDSATDYDFNITIDDGDTSRGYSGCDPATGNGTTVAIITNQFNRSATFNVSFPGTLTDLAGNNLTTTNINATDGVPPGFLNATSGGGAVTPNVSRYSYYNKTLILVFNESVDLVNTSKIRVNTTTGATGRGMILWQILTSNTTADGTPAGNMGGTMPTGHITIVLTNLGRDNISGWKDVHLAVEFNDSAVKDISGNALNQTGLLVINNTLDKSNGTLINVTYSHRNATLTLVFNETIDTSSLDITKITLANQSNMTNASAIVLTSESKIDHSGGNRSAINITLASDHRSNISRWLDGGATRNLYFYLTNVTDVAGNVVNGSEYNGTQPGDKLSFTVSPYTKDNDKPFISSILFNKSRLGNDIRVNNLILQMNVTFNETMDMSENLTVSVMSQNCIKDNVNPAVSYWANNVTYVCEVNLTTAATANEGYLNVTVSGAKDVSRINTMTTNTSRRIFMDVTAPKIISAWMVAGGLGGTNFSSADTNYTNWTLVVQFNENLSMNFSTPANNGTVFNLTSSGDNLSTTHILRDAENFTWLNITLGYTDAGVAAERPVITPRGVFDPAHTGPGAPSGITIMNTLIEDQAGNKAVNTSATPALAIDVADQMISFNANQAKTFSVPYCVNTTMMANQLRNVTGSCTSYTAGSWSTVSSGNFLPLRGYKCTFSGGNLPFRLLVYTQNQSDCALESTTASLAEGFNLVGVDGVNRTSAVPLFSSLDNGQGAASAVTRLYIDVDHSLDIINNGNLAQAGGYLNPYQGYWIFLNQADVYAGNGLN